MKSLLFYIWSILVPAFSYASSAQWFSGSLVLNDQQVLVGEISIESRHNVVLFKHNEVVDVYPAHKVQGVRFYDRQLDVNRKFISVRSSSSVLRTYQLYEVVFQGEISLLRREESNLVSERMEHEAFEFHYLVRYKGELISLKKFRSRIYPELKHSPVIELQAFVKKNKLNPNNESNAIRIIQYYNSVVRPTGGLALN